MPSNPIYYYAFKRDAYGMGDVKWTLLAIATFSINPRLSHGAGGVWLGLLWLGRQSWCVGRGGCMRGIPEKANLSVIRPRDHVHFAPFLFAGLLAGLYVCYLP